jgi:hypothetical protein
MSVPKNHGLSPAFDSGHGRGRIYNDIAGDGHCDIGDARQQVAFVLAARAQSARELMSSATASRGGGTVRPTRSGST